MLKSQVRLSIRIFLFVFLLVFSLPIFCAIDSIRRVAEDIGDPSAQYLLGHMYASGQEVNVDMAEAQKWFGKAAKQGHVEAQFRLAKIFYDKGMYKQAHSWFRESALKGWPDSQYYLGLMNLKGQGIAQDYAKAKSHFEKASRRSHGEAMYEMGQMHYQGRGVSTSNKQARSWFFKASKNGSIRAQYELGRFLYAGIGGPKRTQQAKLWLEKAAAGGIKDAQPLLRRLGVKPKSLESIIKASRKSAPAPGTEKKTQAKSQKPNKKSAAKAAKSAPVVDIAKGSAPADMENKARKGDSKAQFRLAEYYEKHQDMDKALHWYEQSAMRGSLKAKMYLADIHSFGKGVKKDPRVALIWWRAAAEKHKHDEAYFQMGQSYKLGYGVRKNQQRAAVWYRKAAHKGHAMAQLELGRMYKDGMGVNKSIKEAKKWLEKAKKQGVPEALQLLAGLQAAPQDKPGRAVTLAAKPPMTITPPPAKPPIAKMVKPSLKAKQQNTKRKTASAVPLQPWEMGQDNKVSKPNVSTARPLEKTAVSNGSSDTLFIRRKDLLNIPFNTLMVEAKQGQAKAQFALGLIYMHGYQDVAKDNGQAEYWLSKAAQQAHGEAQYTLGAFYEENKRYQKSMKWYRHATGNQFTKANIAIGNLFRRGKGVSRDYLRAAQWYKKAAKQRDPEAQFLLAQMYHRGLGVNRDRLTALKWYQTAARNAYRPAQYELGKIYFKMGGRNLQEAKRWEGIKWMEKAAEGKYVDAQLKLGRIYEEGDQVNKNFKKAAYWYGMAANQGHAASQTKMASFYRIGRGVNKDIDKSIKWYQAAAEQKYTDALFALGEIFHRGESVEINLETAAKWYQMAADQGDRRAMGRLRSIKNQNRPSNMVGSSIPN